MQILTAFALLIPAFSLLYLSLIHILLHSSPRRFSTGVPVSAKRTRLFTPHTALYFWVVWFLMAWASSRMQA